MAKEAMAKKNPPVREPAQSNASTTRQPLLTSFRPNIRVIGIGGGASAIVSEIGRSLKKMKFVVADTDSRNRVNGNGISRMLFGQEFTRGLGTGLNVGLAEEAAFRERERFLKLFEDQDIVIVIACLGGGLGSGATRVFLEQAQKFPGILMGIFTLPFSFEGAEKARIAAKALREIQSLVNVAITIPNEKIFKIVGSETAITKAFSAVNKNLAESLGSLIELISTPGLINIDFADLRSVLSGRGNAGYLHSVEVSGKNRAEKAASLILRNPLYQRNRFMAEKILFNIAGSQDLSMMEIERISREVSEKNPGAKIIFGISRLPALKNKIRATLLMAGGAGRIAEKQKLDSAVKNATQKPKTKATEKPVTQERKKKIKKAASKKLKKAPAAKQPAIALPPPFMPADTGKEKAVAVAVSSVAAPNDNGSQPIRRNGLEAKKAQEERQEFQSAQEKEWEIPAFLRFKK